MVLVRYFFGVVLGHVYIELLQGLLRIIFAGLSFSVPLGLCYRVDLGLSGHFMACLGLC